MLYWLARELTPVASGFNVFSYLTLRAILAVMTALLLSLLIGPAMIARLSRYQIGQVVRDDGPQTHLKKAGTPTMGGLLILVTIFVSALLWGDLRNRYLWVDRSCALMSCQSRGRFGQKRRGSLSSGSVGSG